MKTLLLMRHGKSSWKFPDLADRERPLTKKGIKATQRMGELLGDRELIPQRILASSAVRALETARLVSEACHCADIVSAVDGLYLAEPDIYINTLKTLPDELERVMVVGHNPGLESLLQILSGEIETLPTAVVAFISLPISRWIDLSNETEGQLIEIWRPKELPEGAKEEPPKEKGKSKPKGKDKEKMKKQASEKKSKKKGSD